MTRKPRLLALAMVALLASAPNVRADQPVAESDQVLPARPLQNANPIEPSTTTMAYAASAEESGQPASAQQSGQPSNHSRRKFWIAITPLIVAGAYILIIYLLAPST